MFSYHPQIIKRYPTIRAGVVYAEGLVNDVSPEGLLNKYRAEQLVAAKELVGVSPAAVASLAAWRRVFTDFGVKPTKYRSAAEALLRQLFKDGFLISMNLLVDIANLVSIRWRLPVAVMNQARVAGSTVVRFAEGDEQFTELGSSREVPPAPGEVIFADEDGVVIARRWCWRQSAQSAAIPDTAVALYLVEGHHRDAEEDTAAAAEYLVRLLSTYQPQAWLEPALLSPDNPGFTPSEGGRLKRDGFATANLMRRTMIRNRSIQLGGEGF